MSSLLQTLCMSKLGKHMKKFIFTSFPTDIYVNLQPHPMCINHAQLISVPHKIQVKTKSLTPGDFAHPDPNMKPLNHGKQKYMSQ